MQSPRIEDNLRYIYARLGIPPLVFDVLQVLGGVANPQLDHFMVPALRSVKEISLRLQCAMEMRGLDPRDYSVRPSPSAGGEEEKGCPACGVSIKQDWDSIEEHELSSQHIEAIARILQMNPDVFFETQDCEKCKQTIKYTTTEAFNEHLFGGTTCLPKTSVAVLEDETQAAAGEPVPSEIESCVTLNPFDVLYALLDDFCNHPAGALHTPSNEFTEFTSLGYTPFCDDLSYYPPNFASSLGVFPLTTSFRPLHDWTRAIIPSHSPSPYDLDLDLESEEFDLFGIVNEGLQELQDMASYECSTFSPF